ncbi:65-kDa microtubule-associated protein 1-like isoform X2 [Wolffia australiana]
MAVHSDQRSIFQGQTSCGSLLHQLQEIWDEVGESEEERDRMLLELDMDCLNVYQRKVEQASRSRADLLKSLADCNIELNNLIYALGETSVSWKPQSHGRTIKQQLAAMSPALEQLRRKKEERLNEFVNVQCQIQSINREINGSSKGDEQNTAPIIDESDLSSNKFSEFQSQLQELQRDKCERLQKVMEFVGAIRDLSIILGIDYVRTVSEIHPSLADSVEFKSKSISNDTLSNLSSTILSLTEEKKTRLQKLQESALQLIELWNLMDTRMEERRNFDHITCNIASTVDEVKAPGSLSLDLIEQAENEVKRLNHLKFIKMTEIASKKQAELEDIYSRAHIKLDPAATREKIMARIESGDIEPSDLIAEMDNRILKARAQALGRKEVLERVDKWLLTCEEERWLEDYNRDANRYNAGRGSHLNLKRAEKARQLVHKIPALVETLNAKTRTWEAENGTAFIYDGAPLLSMLDKYLLLRQDKEEEKRRTRKLSGQKNAEQETVFWSRPSPGRSTVPKKTSVVAPANGNGTAVRRASVGGATTRPAARGGKRDGVRLSAPANCDAFSRKDVAAIQTLCP